jgi:hypothetical protein
MQTGFGSRRVSRNVEVPDAGERDARTWSEPKSRTRVSFPVIGVKSPMSKVKVPTQQCAVTLREGTGGTWLLFVMVTEERAYMGNAPRLCRDRQGLDELVSL